MFNLKTYTYHQIKENGENDRETSLSPFFIAGTIEKNFVKELIQLR